MTEKLNGRWGPYEPKTPKDKHKNCANGCGLPVAFYDDSPVPSLKHGGCCSDDCMRALEAKAQKAASPVAPVKVVSHELNSA